MTVEMGWCVT